MSKKIKLSSSIKYLALCAVVVAIVFSFYHNADKTSATTMSTSNISCGGTNCGTHYTMTVAPQCSWSSAGGGCSGTDTTTIPSIPGGASTYVTQITGSSTAGSCSCDPNRSPGAPFYFVNTGALFGQNISVGGEVGTPFSSSGNQSCAAPIINTNSSNQTTQNIIGPAPSISNLPTDGTINIDAGFSGGCRAGGGGGTASYSVTVCNTGYTATGDNQCTQNSVPVPALSALWSDNNSTNQTITLTPGSGQHTINFSFGNSGASGSSVTVTGCTSSRSNQTFTITGNSACSGTYSPPFP